MPACAHAEEEQFRQEDWTEKQRQAYWSEDWQQSSRLRGYTEEAIANYVEFMRLAEVLDDRYGPDFAITMDFEVTYMAGQAAPPDQCAPERAR